MNETSMNYQFKCGDVVRIERGGYGFSYEDAGKWVEITGFGDYYEYPGVSVKEYDVELETKYPGMDGFVGLDSFGPMILLNTVEEQSSSAKQEYSTKHYDTFYHLTDKDIEEGKIKLDAYFVAKQWKVGSRDDSGALFHSLKTIARFGEKNSIDREIKALYNQAKAMARIYGVELD